MSFARLRGDVRERNTGVREFLALEHRTWLGQFPEDPLVFRMNGFFQADEFPYGRWVYAFSWSIPQEDLVNLEGAEWVRDS